MDKVYLSTIFLFITFFIGVIKIIRLDRGVYLQDIRLFFYLSFGLYSLFLPTIYCIVGDIFQFDLDSFSLMTMQYGLAFLGLDVVLFIKNKRWLNRRISINKAKRPKWGLIFLAILVLSSFLQMKSNGIAVFSLGSNMTDRKEYFESVNQLWVVRSILIASTFNYYAFLTNTLSKKYKVIFWSLLVFYILFQISLGNRKEYAAILLFFICFYLCKRRIPLTPKMYIVLITIFIGSFALTLVRDSNTRSMGGSEAVQLALSSNEFVYPQQTTYHIIKDGWNLRYGYTYVVLPVLITIPRELYPSKPSTLGAEFTLKTFGEGWIGYGYTPVSEAYLNFGFIGPFIIFFLLGLLFNKMVNSCNKKGVSFAYMAVFSYIFDFCRGDTATILYTLLFVYVAYLILKKMIKPYRRIECQE